MTSWRIETTLESLVVLQSDEQRLRGGDIEAIAGLIERYQHRLYRYLLRLVSQPSTAEDLFQQTWLRVMERIQNYDPRRSFEGWLFAVAHNLAIDYLRRRLPESLDEPLGPERTLSDVTRSDDPDALEQFLSKERADRLLAAVAELPPTFREVITLRFEEEMKIEEMAGVLGLPTGTIKTRLHRALKALRRSLGKDSGTREIS
jgi:RNA polymerase sigma-70 factor (ECF subfamily)